jgi:hypothetical protein
MANLIMAHVAALQELSRNHEAELPTELCLAILLHWGGMQHPVARAWGEDEGRNTLWSPYRWQRLLAIRERTLLTRLNGLSKDELATLLPVYLGATWAHDLSQADLDWYLRPQIPDRGGVYLLTERYTENWATAFRRFLREEMPSEDQAPAEINWRLVLKPKNALETAGAPR